MKNPVVALFFFVLISIYGLVNYYVYISGLEAFQFSRLCKVIYNIVFLFLAVSYIAGRVLERYRVKASSLLIRAGSFWLGMMLYFLIIIAVFNIFSLLDSFFNFLPSFDNRARAVTAAVILFFVCMIIITGYFVSKRPVVKRIDIQINKFAGGLESLNAVFVSDIHLGVMINNSRLNSMVRQINECRPDIVLMGGDIIDEDISPVIENNLGETLRNIKADMGVYAVPGNHEYIGGIDAACRYLSEHNIKVLRDEAVNVNNCFYIIGRDDRSIKYFNKIERKHLEDLITQSAAESPVILMDHQPFRHRSPYLNRIDLYLSGHTHHGQLWPVNYITSAIFELSRGYKRIGSMQLYVSGGAGTWGPPVRIGSRPEIVNLNIKFTG